MCLVDDAEPCELIYEVFYRTKRLRHCCECKREIHIGETYLKTNTKFEGTFKTYQTCEHCVAAINWLKINCGGYVFTEAAVDLEEHTSILAKRLLTGMRQQWQNENGLMAVIDITGRTNLCTI